LIDNLVVYPKRMKENLNMLNGLIFSQQILLALAESGVTREDAYKMVQQQAMHAWKEKKPFKDLIKKDKNICAHLSKKKIEKIFDVNYHLKYIGIIFDRVFKT